MSPLHGADLRCAAANALVLYLPGLFLARRLARATRTSASAWALPCSLALLLSGLLGAQVGGMTLSQAGPILWTLTVGGACLSLFELLRRNRPEGGEVHVRPAEWLLILATVILLGAVGGPLGLRFDSLDHLGSIRRSLMGNAILPLDQFYKGGDGQGWDPRKGLLPALLAWICRWSHTDPLNSWRLLTAVLAPGILLALSALMRAWLRAGWRSDLGLALWILLGAGSGFLWLSRAGYPNHPSYALAYFAIGLYLMQLRDGPERGRLLGIALLSYTAELIHLVPGLVVGMAVALGALASICGREDRGRRLRSSLEAGLAAGAGLLVPLIFRWAHQGPLVSTLHTHTQGVMDIGGGVLVASPFVCLAQVGWIALFALPLLPLAVHRVAPQLRWILVLFLLGAWALVETPLFMPLRTALGYLITRILDVIPGVPILVLALEEGWARLRRFHFSWRLIAPFLAVLCSLTFVAQGVLRFPHTATSAAADASGPETALSFARALRAIPSLADDGSGSPPVILADPSSSYAVAAVTGGYVVSTLDQHGPPTDVRWRSRMDDQRDMLYGGRGESAADSLLRFYDVDYVYLNALLPTPVSQFGWRSTEELNSLALRRFHRDPARFAAIYAGPEGEVFRVIKERPSAVSDRGPAGTGAAGGVEIAAGVEDSVQTASTGAGGLRLDFGAFAATDVRLPAGPFRKGTIVPVTLRWVRRAGEATDLPLWANMRLLGRPPERWYIRAPWNRLGRLWAQRDGKFYTSRIGLQPLHGIGDLRRLPLGYSVADTLPLYIHWRLVPGRYAMHLDLAPETFLPNLTLRGLLKDEEPGDAPVVGWLEVVP